MTQNDDGGAGVDLNSAISMMQTYAPGESIVVPIFETVDSNDGKALVEMAYRLGWHLCEQRHRREAEERTERFAKALRGERDVETD